MTGMKTVELGSLVREKAGIPLRTIKLLRIEPDMEYALCVWQYGTEERISPRDACILRLTKPELDELSAIFQYR